jgi:hypothetical protein
LDDIVGVVVVGVVVVGVVTARRHLRVFFSMGE